jgi:hypothetical protein
MKTLLISYAAAMVLYQHSLFNCCFAEKTDIMLKR